MHDTCVLIHDPSFAAAAPPAFVCVWPNYGCMFSSTSREFAEKLGERMNLSKTPRADSPISRDFFEDCVTILLFLFIQGLRLRVAAAARPRHLA